MHALPTKTLDPQTNQAPAPVDDVQLASRTGTGLARAFTPSQWQPVGAQQMTRLYLCSDTIKEIGVSALVVGSDGTSGCSAGCPPTHTKHVTSRLHARTHTHNLSLSLSLSLCLLHFLHATPTVSAASAISQHRMWLKMAEQRECCVDLLLPEPQQGLDQDAHRHQHVGQPSRPHQVNQ